DAGELAGHEKLDMSTLSLSLCGSANGVSALHGDVSRKMFPGREVGHVTNGVHHHTWVGGAMGELFDHHLPGWRSEPRLLGRAATLPDDALRAAHAAQKRQLLAYANAETNKGFRDDVLTLGFARRAATYKRAGLLFSDPQRLVRICGRRVQIIFAGKAHPRDHEGQDVVASVHRAAEQLGGRLRVAYLPNYNMWSGALITSGVDVWLNNPVRPREASGTSGMKATLNGVPNASIADGWWAEAVRDGKNGWLIGQPHDDADDERDADALYRVLESRVIPTYYEERHAWTTICKEAIVTGAQFTADRMLHEYMSKYYRS
ncbi:MAG: alpha-glucan family phosphorylase, partial [Trueperaceae bacterium]|nr:alpha-glucan family phosphorylase [Trueperaceae bacterium]